MADLSIPCATLGAIRHLAHELRQPLSGIESIAYYLEMILPEADDLVHDQFDRLRQLIQQANWILQDSVQAARVATPVPARVDLRRLLAHITAEIAGREEMHLQLQMEEGIPEILCDESQAHSALRSTLDFFRFVARSDELVRIHAAAAPAGARLEISAESDHIDGPGFHRLLDPRPCGESGEAALPVGSIRRQVEANGGSLRLHATEEGRLTAEIFFPAA